MDEPTSFSRPAKRRLVLAFLLPTILAAAFAGLTAASFLSGCTAAQSAAFAQRATAIGRAVKADASSPAGQQILADVTSGALNVGLHLASGNDVGAAIAGVQGAASAIRDYEGLPVAPSGATIARAAAAGSGVASVALTLPPTIEALVENARKSAASKQVNLNADAITEAVARGLDAVANAKQPVTLAGKAGEAP